MAPLFINKFDVKYLRTSYFVLRTSYVEVSRLV